MDSRNVRRVRTRTAAAVVAWSLLSTGLVAAAEKGLVLYLPFDGNLDAAVGKDVGAVRAKGNPKFVEGRFGQAVSLTDGAHLIVPVPPGIKKGEFSIAFWAKPLWHVGDNLAHTFIHIPGKPENVDSVGWAPGQFILSKGWSEVIAPNHFYGVTDSAVVKRHLRPGQWTHFVVQCSVSGNTRASYLNGEGNRYVLSSRKQAKPPVAHGDVMWLGERPTRSVGGTSGEFVLDDLKVYSRILDPSEIPAVAGATFPAPVEFISVGNVFDITQAVETPHTAWAKPLAGGPVKILCITEGRRAREIAELAQRLDLEPTVLTAPSASEYTLKINPESYTSLGPKVEKALKARNVQCILVAAFGWNLLAESARTAIMDAVKGGAGLVFADPRCLNIGPARGIFQNRGGKLWGGWAHTPEGAAIERLVGRLDRPDEDYLVRPIPWRAVSVFGPTWKTRTPASLFRGGRVGRGRVLVYDLYCGGTYFPGCLTPSTLYVGPLAFDGLDYDYAIGAAARAVLWAAGRVPAVRIEEVAFRTPRFAAPQVAVGTPGEWAIDLRNTGKAKAAVVVTLRSRTHDPDPAFQARRSITLKPGVTRITIPQTVQAVGTTYGDARLLVAGKVADWSTGTVETRHGNPRFVDLAADKPSYGDGEAPQITARFALVKYAYATGKTAEIRWRLYDSHDRLLARGMRSCTCRPSDEDANTVSWALQPLDESSLGYRLIVDLVYRGKVTDRRAIDLWRLQDDVDDYLLVSWQGGGQSMVMRLATLVMRDRHGLDSGGASCLGRQMPSEPLRQQLAWMARHDIRPWIYATHVGSGVDKEKRRMPDLADPGWLASQRDRLAAVARLARRFSVLFYSLGDETKLGPPDYRASGHEQEAFRTMLKARYGTVKKLNQAWDAKYESWSQVVLPEPESKAWKTGGPLLAALADFRETLYADALGAGTQGASSVDPSARVGVEGIFGLINYGTGQDYWKMTQRSTFLGQYKLGMEMNMIRSFQKPGELLGAWYNYAKLDRQYSLHGPWQVLLRGGRMFGWYTTFEGSPLTALNPDFSTYVQFGWTMEELRPLLEGIGKLVVGLDRDDLGVAVLHNQRNLDRCSPQFHGAMVTANLLEDLGIQHDWIHGDQIATGELTKRKLKVLFLPGQFHMSPEVAKAIRAYVNAGGALVADVLPADADGLKRYKKRPLDDLFVAAKAIKGAMPPTSEDDVKAWPSRVNTVGKGKTLLYGAYPTTYNRDRMRPRGRLMRAAVGHFLTACGVRPAATVNPTDGSFQPRIVVTYHDGDALYVATQREYTVADMSPREFEFAAPAKAHAYDVRAGKYLGHTDRAKLTIEVSRGALVAFLPYRVKSIRLVGLQKAYRAGEAVHITPTLVCEGGSPGHGVFRVEVTGPGGARVRALSSKTRWAGGLAHVVLPIAYNDPAGTWTVRVTDVATGVTAERTVAVVASAP